MARMSSTRTAHHHQEYPEQGTDCSTGWFQRQSGCISRLLIWPSWLGQFSTGKKNDNGERMLEMCTYHDLWITNTCFKTKPPLNVSWRKMRSEHWHQLGLILVSHDDLKNVLHTCSFHNANCNIDHSLLEVLQSHVQRQQNAPAWLRGTVCRGFPEGTWCLKTW